MADKNEAALKAAKQKLKAKEKVKKSTAEDDGGAPLRKPPEAFDCYFLAAGSKFYFKNGVGEWQQYSSEQLSLVLRARGFWWKREDGKRLSEVEEFMYDAIMKHGVDWAGELAGWPAGMHVIGTSKVLVPRGRRRVKPRRGPFPLIRTFVKSLLGDQTPYFLGWLKGSLLALDSGFPWQPGQMLALAGDPDCGKSFMQLLVTEILGGRSGDPSNYLLGKTTFTGDFFRAEHLMISDKSLKDCSHSTRRHFGDELKSFVVDQLQQINPKGKEAQYLPVGTRITMSVNLQPQALMILPPLDGDIADKLLVLRCSQGELPAKKSRRITWQQQWDLFIAEIPAFVEYLYRMVVPDKVRHPSNRFTVASYHHPDIVDMLRDLTPEEKLLELLACMELSWPDNGVKTGTAGELEQWLRRRDIGRQLDRVVNNVVRLGHLLANISRQEGEERIRIHGEKKKQNIYAIYRDEL